MEWTNWNFLFYSTTMLFSIFLLLLLHHRRRCKSNLHRLPPGPPGWPIFGNLFDLIGTMPHRTLAGLQKDYGPVVWLRLGSINTMVVLTAKASTEFFKYNDMSFVDRKISCVMKSCNYHKGSIALSPYGLYWRTFRRIVNLEMVAPRRIDQTIPIRRKFIDDMLSWIDKEARNATEPRVIHVAHFVFLASSNIVSNLMFSRDLVDPESKKVSELFLAMTSFIQWSGRPNIADSFPWLRWFDPQGLRRKMDRDMGKAVSIASRIVKERVKERQESRERRKDFLDVLLDFEGKGNEELDKFSEHDISIFILEIFLAGSETTTSTVEWAMTELLRSPETMIKVKAELANVIGLDKKMEESDIDHLPYLQAVVKETMRLHPPLPLLIPRNTIRDTNFMGYEIPKNTQVFINTWAIGRDPECWDDPMSFKPERFLGLKIDYRGQHYEFIPFGAGRRMCAGVSLAHCMLHLLLASLLHEFDWELDGNLTRETMDMKERSGIAVRKLEPLKAIPKRHVVQ